MSLIIRKKSAYTWEHYFDGATVPYITNVFNINNGGNNTFQLVDYRGSNLQAVPIADITLYDDTSGGIAETFSTFAELNTRLGILQYPPMKTNGGSGGGVESVSGVLLNNTDPLNPIVNGLIVGAYSQIKEIAFSGATVTDDGGGKVTVTVTGGGTTPTLQEVLDNNHDLVDGNNFQGTGAGVGNTGALVIALGTDSGKDNTGNVVNAIGNQAGANNTGSGVNFMGLTAGIGNTGDYVNAIGSGSATNNTGTQVNAFGDNAGLNNTHNSVNLLGYQATADAPNQTVFSKFISAGVKFLARLSFTNITADRKWELPDKNGTVAMLDDIPSGDTFIPLSGTTVSNPVTGDVRFLGDTFDFTTAKIYVRRDFNAESGVASESSIIFGGDTDKSGIILKTENLDNGDVSEIRLLEGNIEIISATNQILVNGVSFDQINGIIGDSDYSAVDPSNLLIYAQRQYVQNGLALKANAPLIDTVSSSALTGVATEGILKSYLIEAGTYSASEILNFANDLYKTGTAGTVTSRLYTNTTASLSGAKLLAVNISTAGSRKVPLRRQLVLKNGNIETLATTATVPDDNVNSGTVATIETFNPAIDNYFITTAQNASTGDSTLQNNFKLHY